MKIWLTETLDLKSNSIQESYLIHALLKPQTGIRFEIIGICKKSTFISYVTFINKIFEMLPAHIFSSFSDTLRIIKDPSQIKKKKLPIGIMLRRNRLR